ncbi:alpha/beta hydrolase [Aggregatilineales bacterium SYSU G02658]
MNPLPPVLPGINEHRVVLSNGLSTRVLTCGDEGGVPVLFIHGNASSATFWEETMLALPAGYRAIAYDQRSYGGADPAFKVDATQGMGHFADDAVALLDAFGIEQAHVVGHSMGGSVIFEILMRHPQRVRTATLAATGSPYGFGGSKGTDGQMIWPDGAGSGGGIVNQHFTRLMSEGYRGTDDQSAPRIVMNRFYWKPPFVPAREEDLLTSLLSQHIGPEDYPGDMTPSANWPNVAPGKFGPANALSPLYAGDVTRLYRIDPKPPILWVRGADDQIVSDNSLFDMGTLGALGAVPGWPGAEVYPPQPMVGQTRAVLEQYKAHGGHYEEVVFENCGHTPFIEQPQAFNAALHRHLGG